MGKSMKTEIKCLKSTFEQYEKNENWFSANLKEFEKNHREKFIAVVSPNKFIVKDNLDDLIAELEKKKFLDYAFITSIPPKGVASIL